MKISTRKLASAAVVGAAYAALTLLLAPISFGLVQLRVSEALCILPAFLPCTAWGLWAGCAIANLAGGYGLPDIVFGSLATLGASLSMAAIAKGRSQPLGLGRALAVCLMKIKHFEKTDFALFHPGGSLGKLLTQQVKDLMRKGKNNPTVPQSATVKDALFIMTQSNAAGATSVVDKKGKLLGYFTDGDLRRELQKDESVIHKKITEVMTRNPYHILDTAPAIDAAKMIHSTHVDNIPVLDKTGKVVGIIDEKDLIEFIAMLDKKS